MNRLIVVLLAASTLTLTSRPTATSHGAPGAADVARKVYISADDRDGAPVTDLKAADISVKEGGKDRTVASLEPATGPMDVAILVDDSGTGAFQLAVGRFLEKTHGRGAFSISLLNPQAARLVDFTDDVEALRGAIGRLGSRGRLQADGDQMVEAISDAAKRLQERKSERPVIVAMTIAGGELQSVQPESVLNTLRASGAALNVVFVTGADLGMVMGDGPKQSGGRIEQAGTGAAIAAAAMKIADGLQHQYLLTYTLPDGVKMSDRISVSTSRKGIRLTAPSRITNK
jgi:hypothetical protein